MIVHENLYTMVAAFPLCSNTVWMYACIYLSLCLYRWGFQRQWLITSLQRTTCICISRGRRHRWRRNGSRKWGGITRFSWTRWHTSWGRGGVWIIGITTSRGGVCVYMCVCVHVSMCMCVCVCPCACVCIHVYTFSPVNCYSYIEILIHQLTMYISPNQKAGLGGNLHARLN